MYRLCKIREIKGYRFFQDFTWDEGRCDLFGQNNLIYGWNGSGKTTLCDFLKDLALDSVSGEGIKFSLLFEDTESDAKPVVTQKSIHPVPYILKVFDQNYIQENISKVEGVKHIFAVGKAQKDKVDELKDLKCRMTDQRGIVKKLEDEYTQLQKTFEKAKTEKAKIVKDTVGYTGAYHKNKFYEAYQSMATKKLLPEDEYQDALAAIRAEPRAPISICTCKKMIQPTVRDYVYNILNQTPVNTAIDALMQDPMLNDWVEHGLSIHEEKQSSVCLFCGNPIVESRFEELRAHFNKSYADLVDKIDKTVSLLQDKSKEFTEARSELPNEGLLYPDLRKRYVPLQQEAQQLCDHYIATLAGIIEILQKKKSDMINQEYASEFLTLVDSLSFDYGVFEKISVLMKEHNEKTENYRKSVEMAQKKVEDHLVSQFFDDIQSLDEAVTSKGKEVAVQKEQLEQLTRQVGALEGEVRNSQIPADAINKDIEFIMGRNELVFTNSDLGYQITRKGKKAENLSKGEQNAIALIYFFNTLLDVSADAKNTIIVLDDPISSFDSGFYYNAISYIREKTSHVGQTFIFTHKFSLMKDYSLMYKGKNTKRYTIQRVNGNPHILNEDKALEKYHDEYAYLFKKVYEFVKAPPTDVGEYLPYPNMARRLLEGFLTFKLPQPDLDMIEKVLRLEEGKPTAEGRAILRLLNNHSHLRVIREGEFADDVDSISILPDILKNLLNFIKYHDERHYNTLALQCDPEYDVAGDAVKTEPLPVLRKIKLYEMPTSAGTGALLDESTSREIETSNTECTFAVQVRGDSMEPKIPKDSIVLVKGCEVIDGAGIGVVAYNGEGYCKKVVQTEEGLLLVSLNKTYKPIRVDELDKFHVFGEVVGVHEERFLDTQ